MGWKQCVSGSYDYLNDKGEAIFHIYRAKKKVDNDQFGLYSKWSGQVFYGDKYSDLVSDEDLSCFIMKCLIIAKDRGWDISIEDFDLNPDFSDLEIYDSKMYLEYVNSPRRTKSY